MSSVSSLSDAESDSEQYQRLDQPQVIQKYNQAAQIANKTLRIVLRKAVIPGTSCRSLCVLGDAVIADECAKVYNKVKEMEKGTAFPTCISINDTAGHFSPLTAADDRIIQAGDVVKVDLGAHIDGFIALVGETVVAQKLRGELPTGVDAAAVAASEKLDAPAKLEDLLPYNNATNAIEGKPAQVLVAAHYAAECVHRLLKPGTKNTEITDLIAKVAQLYGVNPVEGVLSHRMKRFEIAHESCIANKAIPDKPVGEFEIEANQVYGIDISFSSGAGTVKQLGNDRVTVFKREENHFSLKRKSSRQVLSAINNRFPLPFALRQLVNPTGKNAPKAPADASADSAPRNEDLATEDRPAAELEALAGGDLDSTTVAAGIVELVRNDLVASYPVLYEKPGEVIASVKFTVLVLPSQSLRITGSQVVLAGEKVDLETVPHPFRAVKVEQDINADAQLKAVLALGTRRTKKSKKKSKAKKKTAAAAAADKQ